MSRIYLIGYKTEKKNEKEWSEHYKILYSCTPEENEDANMTLSIWKDYYETVPEKYINREFLVKLLTEPKAYITFNNPCNEENTREVLEYIEDYEDFLIKE